MNKVVSLVVGGVLLVAVSSSRGGDTESVRWRKLVTLENPADDLLDGGGASSLFWWVFSDMGIRTTTDGGKTWNLANVPPAVRAIPGHLDSVTFFLPNAGVAVREQVLYRTADGGSSWVPLAAFPLGEEGGIIAGVYFLSNASVGWAYGGVYRVATPTPEVPNDAIRVRRDGKGLVLEPAIFLTSDKGEHWAWQKLPAASGHRVTHLEFADARHGVAATDSSVLFTLDGGATWLSGRFFRPVHRGETAAAPSDGRCRLVHLRDQSLGWLSFDNGSIYRTADGGATWQRVTRPGSFQSPYAAADSFITSVFFLSRDLGWGIDVTGGLYETHDGGAKWARYPGPHSRFTKFLWHDESQLIALSDDGLYRLDLARDTRSR